MDLRNTEGKCQTVVDHTVSLGIMGKGKESFRSKPGWCKRNAAEDGRLCKAHAEEMAYIKARNAARRA